jgi:hypothetical protein
MQKIDMDFKGRRREVENWIQMAKDGVHWQALVSTAMNISGRTKCVEFLDKRSDSQFLKKNLFLELS